MFHLYGFILGLAISTMLLVAEKKTKEHNLSERLWWQEIPFLLVGALLGARLYHVATDFYLYQSHLEKIFQIWQGGLSIIGAVMGAGLGALVFRIVALKLSQKSLKLGQLGDLVALSLPFGQAIGRLGNFVNQELYGLPTQLPWKIFIAPEHRLPGFENVAYFHPLFAYEAILLLLFSAVLWYYDAKKPATFGKGKYFVYYLLYYSITRFALDFLRIDKSYFGASFLGKNQVIMAGVFVLSLVVLFFLNQRSTGVPTQHSGKVTNPLKTLALVGLILVGGLLGGCRPNSASSLTAQLQKVPDHSFIMIGHNSQTWKVEVVNSSQSLTQGLSDRDELGSDGMLFVLGQPQVAKFWMSKMRFDLDLVWLNDLKVQEITTNVPKPVPEQPLPIYSPGTKVNMVLELPAGAAKRWSLQVGDELMWRTK